jgi:hypothetical protein
MLEWNPPTSVHQVCDVLGLAQNYQRLIPKFSKIAKLTTELIKKGTKYVWSKDCDDAFLTSPSHSMCIVMLPELDWDVSLCKKGK